MQADYARQYRALWERHWWWRSREALVLALIARLTRPVFPARILDVGCGDGLFFEKLAAFGRVDGLEPDPTLVSDPRWRPRIRVGRLDGEFRGTHDYDVLLMLDVLEHIADDGAALAAARSALRPGGALLITVPALRWLWSRHDEANAHHRRYGLRELRSRLTEAGFVVESIRYFFCWTVLPLLVRRGLSPAGGQTDGYAVAIPPGPVNRALEALSRCEHAAGRLISWPVGSSLLAVARNPARSEEAGERGSPAISAAHVVGVS
jgi:SAM-dependent methyltransferase